MSTIAFRRSVLVLFEISLVVLANYVAFFLRFDGNIPAMFFSSFLTALPYVIVIRAIVFIPFRVYAGLWRYTSVWDVRNIATAVVTSSVAIYCFITFILRVAYPRSIFLMDALLLMFLMSGIRLTWRVYREMPSRQGQKGILIYGAGDAGEMLVREVRNNPSCGMAAIGFMDDNLKKVGHRIHGVPVLGTRHQLKEIMARLKVHEVVIAMPGATARELREIVQALEPFKLPIRTVPSLRDLLDGRATVGQIRNLELGDLLQREPVGLDNRPVRKVLEGRRILVTGAGGSIGSELCRQVASMGPEMLIMLERHEHSLYSIQKDLQISGHHQLIANVVDVTDRLAVRRMLAEYRPRIVFHAAAHKHVPLMEMNACEAIKNNVVGTRIVAEESKHAGVERFILISTDKAVNPASVMGASKRVAELLMQSMGTDGQTCFSTVRFGNVLGSNGSVVPLFLEQIRGGGPVTVTHPEMRRYFMLIPEAVQLVLHAATLVERGTVYVLDMGEEFPVVDLAKNLIRLSGYIPEEEIEIKFVGLRPGEKLSEVLVGSDEVMEPAAVDKIRKVRPRQKTDTRRVQTLIADLEAAALAGRARDVLGILGQIVPTFQPVELTPTGSEIARSSHA